MKNKLKQYLRSGILCFGILFLFWNCRQQDDLTPGEIVQEKKINIISFHDFKDAVAHNESFTSISQYFDKVQASDKSSWFSKTSENILILTDKIIKIYKEQGASYTFRLLKTTSGYEFYNLVVDVGNNGTVQRSAIIEYIPSSAWLTDTSQPFNGHIKVHPNNISNPGNTEKQTGGCYEAVWKWECNAGNEHAPNTCTAGGSDLIITVLEVSCPYEGGGAGGGVSYPVGDESPSGPVGGGSSTGNDGPNPDTIMSSPIGPGDGSIVDAAYFDEQIFIDDSFKDNPCLKSVYGDMGKASRFKEYLQNFEPEFSVAHLRFSSSTSLPSNTNAETSAPHNYIITITFNENNLNRPRLSVARTFIHEMIHAEMFRKLLSVAQHPSIQLDQSQLIQLRNDYPGLYDYYMRWKWNVPQGQSPSSAQHQAMAQHYRGMIKQALQEFDSTQINEVYEALSWIGLQNTVAWNNLSQTERDNINQTINNFNANNPNCQ